MKQNKKKKTGRKKRLKWSWVFLAAFGPLIFLAIVYMIASIQRMRPGFGKGDVGICFSDGTMSVSWQPSFGVNACRIYLYDEAQEDYVLCGEYEGNRAVIVGIEPDREIKLQLQAVRYVGPPGFQWELPGGSSDLTVMPGKLECPVLVKQADTEKKTVEIRWQSEPECSYEVYQIDESGNQRLFAGTDSGKVILDFGNEMEMPDRDTPVRFMVRAVRPMGGYTLYSPISATAVVERKDLFDDQMALRWEQSGERQYILHWEESKGSFYEVQQWSERDNAWMDMGEFTWDGELCYKTARLPSCRQVRFRVVTYDTTAQRGREEYEAPPSEITFRTDLSPLYCTVWPIQALDLTEDAQGGAVIGQVPAGEALCVLGEENGRFQVRYKDDFGYIDTRFCMIDLPEYLGDLCEYDITNSASSIFRVHEYDIPDITDTVIKGYENICLEDREFLVPYLFPCAQKLYQVALRVRVDGYCLRIYDAFRPNEATRYLYDTVEILLNEPVPEKEDDGQDEDTEDMAGEPEEQDGLTEEARMVSEMITSEEIPALKQLPEKTVLSLEAVTEELLSGLRGITPEGREAAGRLTQTGIFVLRNLTLKQLLLLQTMTPEEVAALYGMTPEEIDALQRLTPGDIAVLRDLTETETAMLQEITPEEASALQSLTPEMLSALQGLSKEDRLACWRYVTEDRLTYRKVMTDNRFRLGSFLAAVTSAHNRGIALDLTLVNPATGESLEMQSQMHDLSWHSTLAQNNANADLLARYMKEAGFHDLSSEWWHFQDDETRNRIGLNTYLRSGVSAEGWKKDDNGWRYRLEDGSYYRNITVTLENKSCTFDARGYCIETSAERDE